jgi:hypothetical protein
MPGMARPFFLCHGSNSGDALSGRGMPFPGWAFPVHTRIYIITRGVKMYFFR